MSHAVDSVNGVGEPLLANALQDLQARYDRLQLLYQVSDVIHSTLEPQQVLVLIMSEAVRIMRASSGSVVLVNPNNNFLEIQASHGLPITGEALQLKLGEGITGWVARKGKIRTGGGCATGSPLYCCEAKCPLRTRRAPRG